MTHTTKPRSTPLTNDVPPSQLMVSSIGNIFWLFYLFIRNLFYYIRTPRFLCFNVILFYYYQLYYSHSRYNMEQKKASKPLQDLTYGETPIITLEKAIQTIPIRPQDFFLDLGCGKGKLVYYMYYRYHIRAAGLDLIPTYIRTAQQFSKSRGIQNVKFLEKDFLLSKFPHATIVFVSCTCLSDTTQIQLTTTLEQLQKNAYVISVSSPIISDAFIPCHSFKGLLSWGRGTIYIQKKR